MIKKHKRKELLALKNISPKFTNLPKSLLLISLIIQQMSQEACKLIGRSKPTDMKAKEI